MTPTKVILCPGQGAQSVGMGRAWFDASPAAAQVFAQADAALGSFDARFGKTLSELCFTGPDDILNRTDVAQAAIFTVGIACHRAGFDSQTPAFAAGLSLGEYTALVVAGAISFEDGFRLVELRGRAMQEAAEARPSGMVALIGADEAQAAELCERAAKGQILVPANFNAPGQIVISGELDACDRAVAVAAEMGLRATKLVVAGAFHSPIMAPAADRLSEALEAVEIRRPPCPVLSNVTGLPHGDGLSPTVTGEFAASIRAELVRQLTRPVRWTECCQWLARAAGPNESRPQASDFHELAPGRVLAGLMRRIDRTVKVVNHEEPSAA